jgi:hypothetical protein
MGEFVLGMLVGVVVTFCTFLLGVIGGLIAEEKHVTGEWPRSGNKKKWYDL